mmetsp:Transcript_10676/g.15500  ORF Transcript_10676/g.15500 Transcript_10676/m.15500 type:complete len:188 (-) Transcript_10676:222-785(-)
MVLFFLCIKAEIEGVEAISLVRDSNICISVRNPLSDYETREKVVFNPSEHLEAEEENSREPPCHFALKWEGSKKRSTIEILDEAACKTAMKKLNKGKKGPIAPEVGVPRIVTMDDNETFVPILAMECRGIEPYEFHIMGGDFIVIGEGGGKFEADTVDLSEGSWADYDEENDISVFISSFESKFVSA